MAVSKKRAGLSTTPPSEEPFQALIDSGAAEPDVVAEAYGVTLKAWEAAGGRRPIVRPVEERPEIDDAPLTVGRLLINLNRRRLFEDGGVHPSPTDPRGQA